MRTLIIESLRDRMLFREEELDIPFDQELLDRAKAVINLFCDHASPFKHFDVSAWCGVDDEVTVIFNGHHHIRTLTVDFSSHSEQYSNPGELVLDPFGGIGTVPLRAKMLGRKGLGIELSKSYYEDALWHLRKSDQGDPQISLFDVLEVTA